MAEDAPTQKIDAPPPTAPPQQPRDGTVAAQPPPAPPAPPVARPPTPDPPVAADPLAAASAGFGRRGKLRRRLRSLRNARAAEVVKLGTLALDARKRMNGSQPEVLTRRAAEVAELDRQVRELQHAVDPHAEQRVIASGIAGTCRECGGLVSTDDRFCANCGAAMTRRPRPAEGGVPDKATPGGQIVHTPAPLPPPVPGAAQAPLPPPVPGTAQKPTNPPPAP